MSELKYKRVVFLTGAGISAESGVATFRDSNGLWEGNSVEDVASPAGFKRKPKLVWQFYSLRRMHAHKAQPNVAHSALAETIQKLETMAGRALLITQNVDTLHERAFGALPHKNFIDIHGSLSRSKCIKCSKVYADRWSYFSKDGDIALEHADNLWSHPSLPSLLSAPQRDTHGLPLSPCCSAHLRPDIVWFGERPFGIEAAIDQLTSCELFISIGTSGNVYPAAGLAAVARKAGAHTVCINLEQPENHSSFQEQIQGLATEILPDFLNKTFHHHQKS
ncbi:MAG: NAD-dependent protein deacylase [Pseudomonadota bacterium]